jgi:hypothetical protein
VLREYLFESFLVHRTASTPTSSGLAKISPHPNWQQDFCTATTMAEATEVNPIVFFDVTLGGMPARTYSYMARQPLTPHRTLFSFAHVLLRDLPTTMTDISKQERSWEESRWSCSRMWFPRLLRTFVNFALARPRTIEVSRRATRAANFIVW